MSEVTNLSVAFGVVFLLGSTVPDFLALSLQVWQPVDAHGDLQVQGSLSKKAESGW